MRRASCSPTSPPETSTRTRRSTCSTRSRSWWAPPASPRSSPPTTSISQIAWTAALPFATARWSSFSERVRSQGQEQMMPRVRAVVVTMLLALVSPASAEVLDLAAASCKDFTAGKKEVATAIVLWLSGFYTKDDDPQVIDFDKVRAKSDKLADF